MTDEDTILVENTLAKVRNEFKDKCAEPFVPYVKIVEHICGYNEKHKQCLMGLELNVFTDEGVYPVTAFIR